MLRLCDEVVVDELRWLASEGPGMAVQILVAALSGATVGYERELHDSPAGMKTCLLVCVGATAYTHVGAVLFAHLGAGDPARMASQIVSGIGFLGAGAIIRDAGSVHGLTTAATVWFIGAVGIIIGVGYPISGLLLAVVTVLLVSGMRTVERWLFPGRAGPR